MPFYWATLLDSQGETSRSLQKLPWKVQWKVHVPQLGRSCNLQLFKTWRLQESCQNIFCFRFCFCNVDGVMMDVCSCLLFSEPLWMKHFFEQWKKPGCLDFIGDAKYYIDITQLYRDYNKRWNKDPCWITSISWISQGTPVCFSWLDWQSVDDPLQDGNLWK